MKTKNTLLVFTGLLLIAAALCLTLYNLYDEHRAARSITQIMEHIEQPQPIQPTAPPIENPPPPITSETTPGNTPDQPTETPITYIAGQDYIGILEIPACGLRLPVISQWSDSKLKLAPCRYQGSAANDDLIIAAHNYRSHFGRLATLTPGDNITFTDMDGHITAYTVTTTEILDDTAIKEMASGDWNLTLFTCTTGNTARVTVRCKRAQQTDA